MISIHFMSYQMHWDTERENDSKADRDPPVLLNDMKVERGRIIPTILFADLSIIIMDERDLIIRETDTWNQQVQFRNARQFLILKVYTII